MADFFIKRGDLSPVLEMTLKDGDGRAVNLATAQSVVLRMRERSTATNLAIAGTCVVTGSGRGEAEYRWVDGETDAGGTYRGEVFVTWSDGRTQTFPTRGWFEIIIGDSLAAS